MLGGDESDKIIIGTQEKTSKKILIEEIPQQPLPARKKSLPNINTTEPEHRLFSDHDEFNRQKLIAEFYMPDVRSFKDISIDANDDRLVVSSAKHGYAFDGFLPHKIDEKKTLAEFDGDRMVSFECHTSEFNLINLFLFLSRFSKLRWWFNGFMYLEWK